LHSTDNRPDREEIRCRPQRGCGGAGVFPAPLVSSVGGVPRHPPLGWKPWVLPDL